MANRPTIRITATDDFSQIFSKAYYQLMEMGEQSLASQVAAMEGEAGTYGTDADIAFQFVEMYVNIFVEDNLG